MVMAADMLLRVLFALALAVLMLGAVAAWSSANMTKRVAALGLAMTGAVLGLAALGAPGALMIACVAIGFAHLGIGVALLARAQEGYGAIEAPEIDAADRQDEHAERGA